MSTFIIVYLHPPENSRLSIGCTPESFPFDQLFLYLFVDRFHFPQRLGVMGPGMRMMDALCLQVSFKTVYPMPGIKHKSTVCQHLFHLAIAVYGVLHYPNDRINGGLIQ